jgi:hypothetical protein
MSEIVPLQLSELLAQKAIEIVGLPNDQVLAICDLQMESEQQEFLSDLLARQREGQLNNHEEFNQLNELMQVYRRGLILKAKA